MKKRMILILVSIFSVFICFFSLTGCTYNTGNQDVAQAQFVSGTTPFETLSEFVTTFPNRTSVQSFGKDSAKEAALWIAEQLKGFGYFPSYNADTQNEGLDMFSYKNSVTDKEEIAYNVAFKKESSSNKTVVIGAHYDNVYELTSDGSKLYTDGTYSNGVGVATLIETARVLQNVDLPFDVEFVAFGAMEFGWIGSQRYLDNRVDKQDIVLMVNFDRNAIGDYVYMYSSEAKTKHNDFFYDIAREKNLCIADLPAYRSPSSQSAQYNSIHSNEANWTDSQAFLVQGINIINFISMNFAKTKAVESLDRDNIGWTKDDNFVHVVSMLGGEEKAKQFIDKQINSAISAVVYAFEKENFLDVMMASKANAGLDAFASSIVMIAISTGLVIAAIIACIILYFVFKQTAKRHDIYVNTGYGRVNMSTGKLEQDDNKTANVEKSVGDIFGSEFESKQPNGQTGEQGTESRGSTDKTNDIFGDF